MISAGCMVNLSPLYRLGFLGHHQKLPGQGSDGKHEVATDEPASGREPRFHTERHESGFAVNNSPIIGSEKIPESDVRERGFVGIVIEIAARFQPEIGLNGNEATAGTQNSIRLGEYGCSLFDREMLEKVGSKHAPQGLCTQREMLQSGLDQRCYGIAPVLR